jgi:hypothetical protein
MGAVTVTVLWLVVLPVTMGTTGTGNYRKVILVLLALRTVLLSLWLPQRLEGLRATTGAHACQPGIIITDYDGRSTVGW